MVELLCAKHVNVITCIIYNNAATEFGHRSIVLLAVLLAFKGFRGLFIIYTSLHEFNDNLIRI